MTACTVLANGEKDRRLASDSKLLICLPLLLLDVTIGDNLEFLLMSCFISASSISTCCCSNTSVVLGLQRKAIAGDGADKEPLTPTPENSFRVQGSHTVTVPIPTGNVHEMLYSE